MRRYDEITNQEVETNTNNPELTLENENSRSQVNTIPMKKFQCEEIHAEFRGGKHKVSKNKYLKQQSKICSKYQTKDSLMIRQFETRLTH